MLTDLGLAFRENHEVSVRDTRLCGAN